MVVVVDGSGGGRVWWDSVAHLFSRILSPLPDDEGASGESMGRLTPLPPSSDAIRIAVASSRAQCSARATRLNGNGVS